ncbi:MAG: hypothetical protein CSA94_00435 [Bacteroidetes bacterium]|nr:MAG: hypothetical protein CSA94_00435 [Bacteroidota bacterium]
MYPCNLIAGFDPLVLNHLKPNLMKKIFTNISACLIIMLMISCSKEDTKLNSEQLFFSFKTPEWERSIPCDKIKFPPDNQISEEISYVQASSISTNASFTFSFPADSSAMASASNIKSYGIVGYQNTDNMKSFSISMKLNKKGPEDPKYRLISLDGFSDKDYNKVTSIEYVDSDSKYANFIIKGNYKMKMLVIGGEKEEFQHVTGSYCIKLNTYKK